MNQTRAFEQMIIDKKRLWTYLAIFIIFEFISLAFLIVCILMTSFSFIWGIVTPALARPFVAYFLQTHKTMKWYLLAIQEMLGKSQKVYPELVGKMGFYIWLFVPLLLVFYLLCCLVRLSMAKSGKRDLPNWNWLEDGSVDWKKE